MTFIHNDVRRGAYLDSVALMRIARAVQEMDGVTVAGLMIGTPANLEILRDANVLTNAGAAAGPGDIVIAVRATSEAQGLAAMVEARRLMDQPRRHTAGPNAWAPRTLRSAIIEAPTANLALISVPGVYAIAEARKALHAGLHAMIFSDNITVDDEAELKREARDLGLLVMGPDCGTAIIGGTPLAFANVVARGPIGIIGASGTGIQEISCLITHAGHGVSHAIGTGGRDRTGACGPERQAFYDLLPGRWRARHASQRACSHDPCGRSTGCLPLAGAKLKISGLITATRPTTGRCPWPVRGRHVGG
jgi:FdrA protein